MASELTHGEAATWHFIQRLTDLAQGIVEQEVRAAANLTGSEFDVLQCLADADDHQLRQNALAALLEWDKSRLSHQLTRMEHRGLIERQKSGRIHAVTITRLGQQRHELAGSAHSAAVRTLLLDHLTTDELEALRHTAELKNSVPSVDAPLPEARSQGPLRVETRALPPVRPLLPRTS